MALLATGIATEFKRGLYAYQVLIGTGTSAAVISLNGLTGVALTDLATSASKYGTISLPECKITATLTGDAKLAIEPVAIDAR